MSGMALATLGSNLVTAAPSVDWQTALETFLNTLSSPRTSRAYKRAVEEAMRAMNVDLVADLTRPMLARYRAGLVARLDTDRADRLSPSTVSLKLAGLRSFLHFCRVTGIIVLSKDVIAFVLKSPKAKVQKPISPHSLRHTMAIETLKAGAGPVIVQKLLGHASLSTTQRCVDHLERADLGRWAFSPA
jgi:site-specific recombinase XerD